MRFNRLTRVIAIGFVGIAAHCSLAEAPPNIVMIISDDQMYSDFGFMGNPRVQTPHLDQLARNSARYTNGYVPSSVCRPSLATLLTGLYPHQHGVHFNHPPPGFAALTKTPTLGKREYDQLREKGAALIRTVPTLPRILARHGYRCLQTGKYWEGHWRNAGFTEGMTIAEPSGGKYGDKLLASGDRVAHGNGDHGLTIGRETMEPIDDFIDDCDQNPFMIWYAPFLPHTPHDSPQRYFDLYANSDDVAKHELPYYAAISQFDETVGRLIDALDKRGLIERTLIVFVVDNGWQPDPNRFRAERNEWDHTKQSKRAPFDAGLRTPILFSWQGETHPATHDAPVSSVDLVPTILAAAGIQFDASTYPGENLWPSAIGNAMPTQNRAVFGEIYPGDATVLGNPARDLAYRWIRRGRFKLIVPHTRDGSPAWNRYLSGAALYNVVADPNETEDLIADDTREQTRRDLMAALNRWWTPD